MQNTYPNDGAYPFQSSDAHNMNNPNYGLTKREYFAALAMQANADNDENTPEQIASLAVNLADALINELNKEVQP